MDTIIPRDQVVTRIIGKQNSEVKAAFARINDKLRSTDVLPVEFKLEDFGPNMVVRSEVESYVKKAGYRVEFKMDIGDQIDDGKNQRYEVS